MKISLCLGPNLRAVQTIQKALVESNGNYEGMADQKSH